MEERREEETVVIRVPREVAELLKELKEATGARSVAEAVRQAFNLIQNPLAVLAFAMDMRSDVKKLIRELERLNSNLERILQAVTAATAKQ